MNQKIIFLIFFVIGFAAVSIYLQTRSNNDASVLPVVASFEECVDAGYMVRETWPVQCQDSAGNLFTQDIGNEMQKLDLITIENTRPLQVVSFPLEIKGSAVGGWYFEADFPVYLYDSNDVLLSQAIATAQDEWMTEDFVEFLATIELAEGVEITTDTGYLVLEKDNPSDLEENADSLIVPVRFAQ